MNKEKRKRSKIESDRKRITKIQNQEKSNEQLEQKTRDKKRKANQIITTTTTISTSSTTRQQKRVKIRSVEKGSAIPVFMIDNKEFVSLYDMRNSYRGEDLKQYKYNLIKYVQKVKRHTPENVLSISNKLLRENNPTMKRTENILHLSPTKTNKFLAVEQFNYYNNKSNNVIEINRNKTLTIITNYTQLYCTELDSKCTELDSNHIQLDSKEHLDSNHIQLDSKEEFKKCLVMCKTKEDSEQIESVSEQQQQQ